MWYGTSQPKPDVYRYRTIDGDYAIRVTCWHRAQATLAWPNKSTVDNWAWYAELNPCRMVPDCPDFHHHLDNERRHADWGGDYVDMAALGRRPNWRTDAAKNHRKRR